MRNLRKCIMTCTMGILVGMAIGACNSDVVCYTLKKGKKELRKLKKKYSLM